MEECQRQLHSHYNTFSKVKIIPWKPTSAIHIDEIYTQLSWVRDDRKPSGMTQEELKDYADIFKGDKHHPNPRRLLVYGRPGVGKSTFAQKTAFDWAKQRKGILMKFDVVLLIKLRDVCHLKDIRDVLRASELLAGDEVVSVDRVYEYVLQNQEKVLLILDGYDEYFCSGDQSPVRDIWEGKLLRQIQVIITTRQEKADELISPSHVQFEINGFKSDDQVKVFASKFFKEDVEEFVSYLHERNLRVMAEIPLLLLMLCLVWMEKHLRELLKSRADIYKQFLQTFLHHAVAKDAKATQFTKIDDYKEELCTIGKLAFDALLEDRLSFSLNKLPANVLMTKLIEAGLFHVLNVSSLEPEKAVYFIHKSVQEFLAAFYLKEELLKESSTTCLSEVDSFEKIVKMIEVLRFVCELSTGATCAVLNHLGIVGRKEGLTEYSFTETPCIRDLSNNQRQFLTLMSHSFFSYASDKRRDLYPKFLAYVGGVLLIDSDQLHSVANEHMLKSAAAPEFIFFSGGRHTEQSYRDLISVLEDLSAVIVSCSGEKNAPAFVKKYPLQHVDDIFLKKEERKTYLYFAQVESQLSCIEMLRELMSWPECTQGKKPVDDQSNEQDDSSALCLRAENSTAETRATQHCLSCVWHISFLGGKRQEMETLIDVLSFVTSPRTIGIYSFAPFPDPVLVDTLVSRINFTNRLDWLTLSAINLTAKPAAVIARSLYQAPNLSYLDLSCNPLGEGVSDLTRHLSCAPHLETLNLDVVKMTKKQVNDLSEAVRQTKISTLRSSYHVSFVIFVTIGFNCLP